MLFGDIVKVTPSSKVVGDMALMMVASDLTPCRGRRSGEGDRVPGFGRADDARRSRPAAGRLAGAAEEGAEGPARRSPSAPARCCRPPISKPSADCRAEDRTPISDAELASYLMYPKVFVDYAQAAEYGPVTVLPTPTFFYGLPAGEEINVTIARGKGIIVRYVGTSELHDDNHRTVFFELNGQPRPIKVVDRTHIKPREPQPKAERDNPRHLGAPMPGVITQISVKPGDQVKRGDALMTLEAMKMQTAIRAELDGTVQSLSVKLGQQVDAKDLLAVIE
jgi:pyruvate carboxylase